MTTACIRLLRSRESVAATCDSNILIQETPYYYLYTSREILCYYLRYTFLIQEAPYYHLRPSRKKPGLLFIILI
jgi:hypothetical protein